MVLICFDSGKIARRTSKVPPRTREGIPSLVGPVDDPRKIVQGRLSRPSMMLATENLPKHIHSPGRDENTRSADEHMTEHLEKEGIKCNSRHSRSSLQKRSKTRGDAVSPRREKYNIVEVLFQEGLNKLNDRAIDLGEKTIIDAHETCNLEHNKAFVKKALCSELNSLLMSIPEEESEIWESVEYKIVQVATSQMVLSKIRYAL